MKVTGIGGVMFISKDPEALSAWYKKHHANGTEHFGNKSRQFILNLKKISLNRHVLV